MAGTGEPTVSVTPRTTGLAQQTEVATMMCNTCAHNHEEQLKPNGMAQHIPVAKVHDHLMGRRHLERISMQERGMPDALVAFGAPLMVPSPNPRLVYRCRPCGLDSDGHIHLNSRRYWQMQNMADLQAHLATDDHLRRAGDGRIIRHVELNVANQLAAQAAVAVVPLAQAALPA